MTMKNNLNKVIITGGAGVIGSNLVKKLLENGTEKILIIDDLSTGKLKNLEDFSNNKSIEINMNEIIGSLVNSAILTGICT